MKKAKSAGEVVTNFKKGNINNYSGTWYDMLRGFLDILSL